MIYQVAWQRLLTLPLGVGAISITMIVSVYMFGLGLGSLLGGWLATRSRDPLALFARVQAALGVAGLASFPILLWFGRASAGNPPAATFIWSFALLTGPTLLMGIGLPLLVTIFNRLTHNFVYSVGRLYFINTLGAAVGAVLTSYVLISLAGLNGCIYIAAAVDFILAAAVLRVRRTSRANTGQEETRIQSRDPRTPREPGLGRLAYLLVFVTGFIAIGYEIIWYRVIGVLVKDSPYAFASVLAVYLFGLAIGSRILYGYLARKSGISRRNLFCILQFLIGAAVLVSIAGFYHLSRHSPLQALIRLSFSADLHPSLALFSGIPAAVSWKNVFLLVDVFLWPLTFVLVPTALIGASFPLIASLAYDRHGCAGRAVGTTYFFNVCGNILGGLATGLGLLPAIGTETTVLIFGGVGLLFGLLVGTIRGKSMPLLVRFAAVLIILVGFFGIFPHPGELYKAMHAPPFSSRTVLFEEGLDAVVLTYESGDRLRNYINGQGHGYRPGPFFLGEAIESLSCSSSPRNVLIIGFGAGSITEAALASDEVRKVTVVELNGSVIANLRRISFFERMFNDPKIRLVIDDGRRFLQRTEERFDVILMDPLRTTTAYSNNLHSREFFALADGHLAESGVLMVGGLDGEEIIARTLSSVFGRVRAYKNFCLVSRRPLRRNQDRFERLLKAFPADIRAAVRDLIRNPLEGESLVVATAGFPINRDWRPFSEYYLGSSLRKRRTRSSLTAEANYLSAKAARPEKSGKGSAAKARDREGRDRTAARAGR